MSKLSPQAQEIMNAWWSCSGSNQTGIAAVLRALIDKCNEPRGTGRVDRKHRVVSVKTLMKLAEELEQV